jgi:hypothetical protein
MVGVVVGPDVRSGDASAPQELQNFASTAKGVLHRGHRESVEGVSADPQWRQNRAACGFSVEQEGQRINAVP